MSRGDALVRVGATGILIPSSFSTQQVPVDSNQPHFGKWWFTAFFGPGVALHTSWLPMCSTRKDVYIVESPNHHGDVTQSKEVANM